jgi:hypothetical protein
VEQYRKPQLTKPKTTLLDVLAAIAIGLALCALLLHSLDALFY